MKYTLLLLSLIIVSVYNINAIDKKFGWTIGNAGLYYNANNNEQMINIDLLRTDLILNKRIDLSISMFTVQFQPYKTNIEYSFLPIEIGFIPLSDKYLNISLYGRGEWRFVQTKNLFWEKPFTPKDNRLFGAVGIRLFVFNSYGDLFHYSCYSSIFLEYTTKNEFKIGITLDPIILGSVITGFIIGILKGEYKQKINEHERTWTHKPDN
jgi:hypothetical protein